MNQRPPKDSPENPYSEFGTRLVSPWFSAARDLVVETFRSQHRRRVLDLGCGEEELSALLLNAGIDVVVGIDGDRHRLQQALDAGVDISKVSVKADREIGLSAFAVDVSNDKLPFDDQAFDLVYAAEVIEHLLNPDFAIEEFARVLRRDGKVLITTPNLASWYNRISLLLGLQPLHSEVSTRRVLGRKFPVLGQGNRPVGHLRLFTLRALVDFLRLHGFRPLSLEGYPLELLSKVWLVESALANFTSLASGFIALCEKRVART